MILFVVGLEIMGMSDIRLSDMLYLCFMYSIMYLRP